MSAIGVKLTHDAALASITIDNNPRLQYSIEAEKIGNAARYSAAPRLDWHREVAVHGDVICIDGWKGGSARGMSVAPYEVEAAPMAASIVNELHAVSFPHVTGHVIGSYMASPFAPNSALVCVWDGGTRAAVYSIHANGSVRKVGDAMSLFGVVYGIMGYYAGPFALSELPEPKDFPAMLGGRDKPGKLMSWIAHGNPNAQHIAAVHAAYDRFARHADRGVAEHEFCRDAVRRCREADGTDADALAAIHVVLGERLVASISRFVDEEKASRLILSGGCALNIKWNSELRRRAGCAVWVPPFCNDSGSAIGAAACELWSRGYRRFDWSVYSGPHMPSAAATNVDGWICIGRKSPEWLAQWMIENENSIVCFLHGRAEIGPRALGHRSLFMLARNGRAKDILNQAKGREEWRPVAPICLLEDAERIFNPGTEDEFMLFDHEVKREWQGIFSSITHIDGTARLQTVSESGCPVVLNLLRAVRRLTGFGILCNTSANLNGSGFFPDGESAMRWGKADLVWVNGLCFIKE